MNTIEKERQCLAITKDYYLPEKPSFGKKMVNLIKQPVTEEPIWLVPLYVAISVILAPVSIYEEIMNYRREKEQYLNVYDKFINFSGHNGEKNILSLWSEYGLEPLNYLGYEKEEIISQCLSKWITILHRDEYQISSEEIIDMFKIQEKRQGKAYNEAYANSGVMISFTDWRVVVVDNILNSLPNYD